MNIISESSQSHLHEDVTYTIDNGMFTTEATVMAALAPIHPDIVENGVWSIDITDVDLNFKVNGERVNYQGFKELHDKLFGEGKFDRFWDKTVGEISEYYEANTKYNRVEDLAPTQQHNLFKALLALAPKGECCGFRYTDDWKLLEVAKKLPFIEVEVANVPHLVSGRVGKHNIIKLDKMGHPCDGRY